MSQDTFIRVLWMLLGCVVVYAMATVAILIAMP